MSHTYTHTLQCHYLDCSGKRKGDHFQGTEEDGNHVQCSGGKAAEEEEVGQEFSKPG